MKWGKTCVHVSVFIDLVMTVTRGHSMCLRHGIPVWQHFGKSNTATSSYRRDMTVYKSGPDVLKRRLVRRWNQDTEWGSNRTNNIDGAEAVRVAHNAILVSRMHLATITLLCKQTTDNFRTRHPLEPRWRHLSDNRILFVPHWSGSWRCCQPKTSYSKPC